MVSDGIEKRFPSNLWQAGRTKSRIMSAITTIFEPGVQSQPRPKFAYCRPISPITLKSGRDGAVDVIKGFACLLMVAAHSPFARFPWLYEVTMGAVLFFASTGMNLAGIVEGRRGQERRLALNALFLIFAGFADNYVQGTMGESDVFQVAGLAILTMLLLRAFLPRYWTLLFPAPFLIHLANQHWHWKTSAGGLASFFLAPGLFSLLPWLSFFLLGAHLKLHDKRQAWLLGAAALAGVGALLLAEPFRFNKWWMSPDYFLLGCAMASWWFAGLRHWLTKSRELKLVEIRRWGANSLVFYIMSNFVIRVLEMFGIKGLPLFLLGAALTAALLRPALIVQAWTAAAKRPLAILGGGIAISACVLAANVWLWPGSFYLRTLTSFGLTFAFVACYPAWKNLSKAITAGGSLASAALPARAASKVRRPFAME